MFVERTKLFRAGHRGRGRTHLKRWGVAHYRAWFLGIESDDNPICGHINLPALSALVQLAAGRAQNSAAIHTRLPRQPTVDVRATPPVSTGKVVLNAALRSNRCKYRRGTRSVCGRRRLLVRAARSHCVCARVGLEPATTPRKPATTPRKPATTPRNPPLLRGLDRREWFKSFLAYLVFGRPRGREGKRRRVHVPADLRGVSA